jgi:hypothetical protein
MDTRWRIWLSLYVTSREVAGSIPHGDLEIFQLPNPATLVLGSTESLTEIKWPQRPGTGAFVR